MKKLSDKVRSIGNLARTVKKLREQGKRVVLCAGIFECILPENLHLLKAAKNKADVLVVIIPSDGHVARGERRSVPDAEVRSEMLASLEMVDFVGITDKSSAASAIRTIRPDIFAYERSEEKTDGKPVFGSDNASEEAAIKSGTEILKVRDGSSDAIVSGSNYFLEAYPEKTREYLRALKKKYPLSAVYEAVGSLRSKRILILGETIIDQYYYCRPIGKSSKEPVMVNQYLSDESFTGGVIASANHVSSVSEHVTLLSVLGKKQSFEKFIRAKLRPEVKPVFFFQPGVRTIIKRRFVEWETKQKLFQISYLDDKPALPKKFEDSILEYLDAHIGDFDLVIVNDFGHGMITDGIIRLVCGKSRFLAINVQANSANYGFNIVTKYPRADFVCIDDQEIRLATHDKNGPLENLVEDMYGRMKCRMMIVTKGPKGAISYCRDEGFRYAPALSNRIVDRVGAGDALFAVTSPFVSAGYPSDLVLFVANVAGALKTQVVGNKKQIETSELEKFIGQLLG